MISAELIALYAEMHALTHSECSNCREPYSCCEERYCQMSIEHAAKHGLVIEPTGHPTISLMGPGGCIAAPHLRPVCTFHTCDIRWHKGKPGDPEWTEKYWYLSRQIIAAERASVK